MQAYTRSGSIILDISELAHCLGLVDPRSTQQACLACSGLLMCV